jgi:general secretion pathway protein D
MRLIKILFLTTVLVLSLSAREKVNVNFSNIEVNDFIKLISKITNKNILINHKVMGTVNLVSTSPIYDDELMGILVSVLKSKGFTLMQNGSLLEVVRSADAAKHNARVVKKGKKLRGSFMVTQAIKINGENVDMMAAKVRYLISKTAKLMTMKESNTILITDYPKNIETIKKVIKDLDSNSKKIVEIFAIKHAELKKLHTRLLDITKSLINEKIATESVKIILDDNTNSLIAVASQKNINILEELIKKLDIESNVSHGVEIFSLKNSDAKSVLNSLTEIISKQIYPDPALKPNVSMSEEINAIIVLGEPGIVKGIKLIIDELDKEKYQVYVQARILEINKNDVEDIGLKYGFAAGDVSSSGIYAMSANFGDTGLTNTASTAVLDALGDIGSTSMRALALGATLDFLQTKSASKSISNPSILCVNNKESSIYVGKTISVSSGTTTGSVGTTASFKREDVGLTLKIKPRVSSVDKVTLDVEAILENIVDDGKNNATGQPITSKQEVKTQAILRHGESIIIGGLVKNYTNKSKNKIPVLGDIPWIGESLFTSKSSTEEEDNLIVMLTPYVVEKSEKLSQLQKDLGELARIQREYNIKVFEKIEKRSSGSNNEKTEKEEH